MSFTYRLHQLPRATQRLARHPKWMAEHVRMALYRRADREQEFRLSNHSPFVVDEHDAVCDVLGVTDAAFQSARERFWAPERDLSEPGASWDARLPLQSLISLCVRLLRPDTMVETGVARGFSTAVSLRAMADVGQGHLYSVELPTLHVGSQRVIG